MRALKLVAAWLAWPGAIQLLVVRTMPALWSVTFVGLVLSFGPALYLALRSRRTGSARSAVVAIFLGAGVLGVVAIGLLFWFWGSPRDAPLLGMALANLVLPLLVALTAAAGLFVLGRPRALVPTGATPRSRLLPISIAMASVCGAVSGAIAWSSHP